MDQRVGGERLKNIPKLPNEFFEMIKSKPPTPPITRTASAPRGDAAPAPTTTTPTTNKELQYFKALCCCLSIAQLDNYSTWVRVA